MTDRIAIFAFGVCRVAMTRRPSPYTSAATNPPITIGAPHSNISPSIDVASRSPRCPALERGTGGLTSQGVGQPAAHHPT